VVFPSFPFARTSSSSHLLQPLCLPRALRSTWDQYFTQRFERGRLTFLLGGVNGLDEDVLANGKGWETTNWKKQYKLRHNWSIGACEVQEIHVRRPSVCSGDAGEVGEGVVVDSGQKDDFELGI